MSDGPEYLDALGNGPVRGRGAGVNPGNRFETTRLSVLGEFLDAQREEHPDGVQVKTTVLRDATRTIINEVDSPDIPYRWTINPYRGCEHGCVYCYARPTHETLGMSCGLDFETKIVAKLDAPTLLAEELDKPRWKGESIVMSGVTDPYQPIEKTLRVTRGCLEVMAARRQPVSIITKNALVLRDLDLLADLAKDNAARVAISLTTLDPEVARKMEPRASSPARRLEAMRDLSRAGVPVAVMTAPIVPGLTDHEIPALLEAARDAGATSAGWVMLRLPWQIKDVFLDWTKREFPLRAARIEAAVRETRDGALYQTEWKVRQRGTGERAEQIKQTFDLFTRRLGLDAPRGGMSSDAFLAKRAALQAERRGPMLFEGL